MVTGCTETETVSKHDLELKLMCANNLTKHQNQVIKKLRKKILELKGTIEMLELSQYR